MTCNHKAIKLVRGNDTNFNDVDFIKAFFTSTQLDLSTFKAVFKLENIIKTFDDITEGIIINFSAQETAKLQQFCNGTLQLVDSENRIATIESLIPFEVVSVVHGNAIVTEPYEITFDVHQEGMTILNFDIKVAGGGGVTQIYMGDTEPTDENILVWIDTYTPPIPDNALYTSDGQVLIDSNGLILLQSVPSILTTINGEILQDNNGLDLVTA